VKVTGLDKLQKQLDQMAKAAKPQQMAATMRSYQCPVHGHPPSNIRVVGNEATAEFCCEVARDGAAAKVTSSITRGWG